VALDVQRRLAGVATVAPVVELRLWRAVELRGGVVGGATDGSRVRLLPLLLQEVATACIALGESLLVQPLVVISFMACSIPGGSLLSAEGAVRVVTEAATGTDGQQLRNLLMEETGLLLHAVQASRVPSEERLRRRRRRGCG
jgi:hypothetical protein